MTKKVKIADSENEKLVIKLDAEKCLLSLLADDECTTSFHFELAEAKELHKHIGEMIVLLEEKIDEPVKVKALGEDLSNFSNETIKAISNLSAKVETLLLRVNVLEQRAPYTDYSRPIYTANANWPTQTNYTDTQMPCNGQGPDTPIPPTMK